MWWPAIYGGLGGLIGAFVGERLGARRERRILRGRLYGGPE